MLTPAEFNRLSFGAKVNIVRTLGTDLTQIKQKGKTSTLYTLYHFMVETISDSVYNEIFEVRLLDTNYNQRIGLYAEAINLDDIKGYMDKLCK